MKNLQTLTYGFIGLGLMGGSLAKAIHKNFPNAPILATDCRIQVLEKSQQEGIINKFYSLSEQNLLLKQADIVFICLYPRATEEFIKDNIHNFKENSIITDISGVKTKLINAFPTGLGNSTSAQFIPGHPMAGSEKEGYIHSNENIFQNRNYILMPYNDTKPDNLSILQELITKIGFTSVIKTDAKTHDHKIAFTSQLCHVIASALVSSAEDTNITQFGGGSFEDLTRIAMINSPLWTELFLTNKNELINHINSFENSLITIKDLIQSDNIKGLQEFLEVVRSKRILMVENQGK